MELHDYIPFQNEFNKAYHGITSNATHTSEKPVFDELRVRRYGKPLAVISAFILDKIYHWIGWFAISEKAAPGGMTTIRAEVSSVLLFGMKINVTFGLFEEKDSSGFLITTVHAKAETQIESRGDLGESRRVIRMMLGAMDFNFNKHQISEEDYHYRSLDSKSSTEEMLQMFNDKPIPQKAKPESVAKATPIEFKKRPLVQTIQIKHSVKREEALPSGITSESNQEQSVAESVPGTESSFSETKPSKQKITIVTTQKNPLKIV